MWANVNYLPFLLNKMSTIPFSSVEMCVCVCVWGGGGPEISEFALT